MLDLIPTALMVFVALAWLRAGTTRDRGHDAELLLGCLMLNAAALVLWNALHGPQRMLSFWAPQAAAAGLLNLLVHSVRHYPQAPVAAWRAAWPSGAFALAAAVILLAAPPVLAQAAPQEELPEELPVIPVKTIPAEPEPVTAKDSAVELPPMVVIGTRTPRAITDVAGSVSVVTARDIEYQQASNLGEVFRDLPGVALEGGPRANAEFINVRGLSGPRVLLIVDGARQNFLGGHRSSLLADPELLKQVELLRGPASALWGSDAVGGVVVMTTKDAKDFLQDGARFGGRLRYGFESVNGERMASGIGALRLGNVDAVFSLADRSSGNYQRGDGKEVENSALDVRGGLLKLGWSPGQSPHRLGFIRQEFGQSGQSPSNPAVDVTGTNPLIDRTNDQTYNIVRYGFEGSDTGWVRAGQFNVYRDWLDIREDRVISPRMDRTQFDTDGLNGHLTLPAPIGIGGPTLFTLGLDGFQDAARATRNGAPRPQYPNADRQLAGAFLQAELPLGPLSVVPGIRYDQYKAQSNQDDSEDVKESAVSPKLGLVYAVVEGVKLRGSLNSAFRAPGLIEIYAAGQHFLGNNFVPNPNLKPEQARSLELGFSVDVPGFGSGQNALLSGSIYRNRVRDFIEMVVTVESQFPAVQCVSPTPPVGCVNRNADGTVNPASPPVFVGGTTSSRNLESATLEGGEIETAYAIGPVKLGAHFSRVRGVDEVTGQPLANISADRLRSTLDLKAPGDWLRGLRGTLGFGRTFPQKRVPTYVDEDGNTRNVIPPTDAYNTWDLSLSYEPLGQRGSVLGIRAPRLVLGVDNLTDEDYRDHLSVLRSPGRNLRASLSAGF